MLAEFAIFPISSGESASGAVAEILDIIDRSGLPYRLTPMATIVEGEWDEVMALIQQCHRACRAKHRRVYTRIHIDDREGATGRLEGKIASVEKKLRRKLKTGEKGNAK